MMGRYLRHNPDSTKHYWYSPESRRRRAEKALEGHNREVRGGWVENARIPALIMLPLACPISPTLRELSTKASRRLDTIKPKARSFEAVRAQISTLVSHSLMDSLKKPVDDSCFLLIDRLFEFSHNKLMSNIQPVVTR